MGRDCTYSESLATFWLDMIECTRVSQVIEGAAEEVRIQASG